MSIHLRPLATADLDDIAVFLEQQRPGYGQRFLQSAQSTLLSLEQMPGLGVNFSSTNPILAGLRHYPVQRFRSYHVFYLTVAGGIDVVRVLHGSRNLPTVLKDSGI